MKNGTTPLWKPDAKKKQRKKTPLVGGAMCEKRSPRGRHSRRQSWPSPPRLVDSSTSQADVSSEDDEATRWRRAIPFGPTITVHTPSGPQQLTTIHYTQYKVVTLKAFLKSKGLSQQGRKADLIARLKK